MLFPDLPWQIAPSLMARIMDSVHFCPATGCWLSELRGNTDGRPQLLMRGPEGRAVLVSRVVWTFHFGPIPEGLFVLHRCDVPPCVCPDHFFLGNHADNMRDCISKGRARYVCGEDVGSAKLTSDEVRAIRAVRHVKPRELAEHFRVSLPLVHKIRAGDVWRHLL